LEIRRKRISDETELALMNYEKALLTHNRAQLAMSEVVMAELVGSEKIAMVLEHEPINDFTCTAPIELAKMPSAKERAAALPPSNANIAPIENIVPQEKSTGAPEPQAALPIIAQASLGAESPVIASIDKTAPEVTSTGSQLPPTSPLVKQTD